MTNPEDTTNRDSVRHDNYSQEAQIDSYVNDIYEASNESYRKRFSTPMIIGAVGFLIFVVLFPNY